MVVAVAAKVTAEAVAVEAADNSSAAVVVAADNNLTAAAVDSRAATPVAAFRAAADNRNPNP